MFRAGAFAVLVLLFSIFALTSCSFNDKPLIIWTDIREFASYAELFNFEHKDCKAVIVYKSDIGKNLPPLRDEIQPDLIVSSYLKNSSCREYFVPLDYIFKDKLKKSDFYKCLLDYGQINDKQYLIPVSFNIPALIFDRKNEALVKDTRIIGLEEIMKLGSDYNVKDEKDSYSRMGFAPSWNADFLYLVSELFGVSYAEKGNSFFWQEEPLNQAVSFIRSWSKKCNTSTAEEQNYAFKYLYMPEYRQVENGSCLFAFLTSDSLFSLSPEYLSDLSFRWVCRDNKLMVSDDMVTMGLYKNSRKRGDAKLFIDWFFNQDTQKRLLERVGSIKTNSVSFGIAKGFSSLVSVNESCYPVYYRSLLSNLPPESYLCVPHMLSARWQSLKNRVVIPYLEDMSFYPENKNVKSLSARIGEWTRQAW